jgi:hypothetical protein
MATQRLTLGEWLPDQPGLVNALSDAKNVIAQQVGYGPIPTAVSISDTATDTTLSSLYAAKDPDGETILFAAGNTDVYTVSGAGALTDVSGETYSATSRVRFSQFGNNILFTNNSQPLQSFVLGSSSAFADLSADAPIAKYITVVRDFVVVANTYESTEQKPYRVRWSDLNDETEWTTSDTTQADFQDLPDGGQIMGIRGGEFGIILLERAIYRMSYIGTPLIFQFDNISRGKGCLSSGSVAQYQGITFFLSDDGFYMCDGQQVTPIGAEKVDRWFFASVDENTLNDISAAVDPIRKTVVWNFKNNAGFYSQLIYNFKVGKWTYADQQMSFVSDASTGALTLEELDDISGSLDALPQSLDSVSYIGGRFFLGGTYNGKVYAFTGANMTGVISSGDIDAGANSVITLARPQVDNGSGSVAVASRRLLSETPTFGTLVAADDENRVPLRSAGRYHRIKLTPTGNNWTTAIAVDYDLVGQGTR